MHDTLVQVSVPLVRRAGLMWRLPFLALGLFSGEDWGPWSEATQTCARVTGHVVPRLSSSKHVVLESGCVSSVFRRCICA